MSRTASQDLALFQNTDAPVTAVSSLASPGYEQREAVFRVLASVSNAGAGYGVTLGCDQAKVIARVMLEHEKLVRENADMRNALEKMRESALLAVSKTKKKRRKRRS